MRGNCETPSTRAGRQNAFWKPEAEVGTAAIASTNAQVRPIALDAR